MTAKIKTWKISEINREMSKYGDAFWCEIIGQETGHNFKEYADENDFVKVGNVDEIIKETEKAVLISIDTFKVWCPKSAIIF